MMVILDEDGWVEPNWVSMLTNVIIIVVTVRIMIITITNIILIISILCKVRRSICETDSQDRHHHYHHYQSS